VQSVAGGERERFGKIFERLGRKSFSMTIWKLLLVLMSTAKFGAGLMDINEPDNAKKVGKVVAHIIVYLLILFLYWKAGVFIFNT